MRAPTPQGLHRGGFDCRLGGWGGKLEHLSNTGLKGQARLAVGQFVSSPLGNVLHSFKAAYLEEEMVGTVFLQDTGATRSLACLRNVYFETVPELDRQPLSVQIFCAFSSFLSFLSGGSPLPLAASYPGLREGSDCFLLHSLASPVGSSLFIGILALVQHQALCGDILSENILL